MKFVCRADQPAMGSFSARSSGSGRLLAKREKSRVEGLFQSVPQPLIFLFDFLQIFPPYSFPEILALTRAQMPFFFSGFWIVPPRTLLMAVM